MFFFGVKGVGDVLAGRGAGCSADAVLLWGLMAVCMAMGRLMFFWIFRIFRALPGCPGVERQWLHNS